MSEYPEEADLERIRKWEPAEGYEKLLEFCQGLWNWDNYWWLENGEHHVATGGWSGNEDIISALGDNYLFWCRCWERSERGGKHVFRVPAPRVPPKEEEGE